MEVVVCDGLITILAAGVAAAGGGCTRLGRASLFPPESSRGAARPTRVKPTKRKRAMTALAPPAAGVTAVAAGGGGGHVEGEGRRRPRGG